MREKVLSNPFNLSLSNSSVDNCQDKNIFVYVNFTIMVVIISVILTSLYQIESNMKCECKDNSNKLFLKEWFLFLICYKIIVLIAFFVSGKECWDNFINYYYLFIIQMIISIISFVMAIRLFLYMRFLKNNCNCAYGGKEKFLYWYYLIIFSILALVITLFIIGMITIAIKFFLK